MAEDMEMFLEEIIKKTNPEEYIKILEQDREDFANEINKLYEVLDKIKEYITTRTPSDIGICGNEPKKYYTLNEDEVDYILELLEEIE